MRKVLLKEVSVVKKCIYRILISTDKPMLGIASRWDGK